jgi:hypothetical protein
MPSGPVAYEPNELREIGVLLARRRQREFSEEHRLCYAGCTAVQRA